MEGSGLDLICGTIPHLPVETDENHEKLLVSLPRFVPVTSRTRSRYANHSIGGQLIVSRSMETALLNVIFCELTGCCIYLKLIFHNLPEVPDRNSVRTANKFGELSPRNIPDVHRLNVSTKLKLLADMNYLCSKDKLCSVTNTVS